MDFSSLLDQASKMQEDMKIKQDKLDKTLFEVESNGGIKISIYGNYKINNIEIDDQLYKDVDKDMLQDMLLAGINKAVDLVTKKQQELTSSISSNMDFSGLF